jgi:hypothetical protein
MIASFDKKIADSLLAQLKGALDPLLKEHSLSLTKANGRYDDNVLKVSLELSVAGGKSRREEQDYRDWAPLFDLDSSWYGLPFAFADGTVYKIAGIKPRAKKNAVIIARVSDGKRFLGPASVVRDYIQRELSKGKAA